ncbi:HIT family protein [Palleronia marisminoris]|nr:hypothetical protein [Palleronia marisminoris]
MYEGVASHRIIAKTDRFVVIPTLGQIFEGSLLILPTAHVETCAALDDGARAEMLGLVDNMVTRCAVWGSPIVFEHGATSAMGGGCGLHHAHLHVVPLPKRTRPELMFPEASATAKDLAEAWRALSGSNHYLLIGHSDGVRLRNLDIHPGTFQSQFFRRRIAEHFSLDRPWDWRSYKGIEPAVLKVLAESVPDAV